MGSVEGFVLNEEPVQSVSKNVTKGIKFQDLILWQDICHRKKV